VHAVKRVNHYNKEIDYTIRFIGFLFDFITTTVQRKKGKLARIVKKKIEDNDRNEWIMPLFIYELPQIEFACL